MKIGIAVYLRFESPRRQQLVRVAGQEHYSTGRWCFSVKPGITCIWQVTARHRVSFEERMKMDLEHIDNCSLWLDLKLVARTALAVLGMTGQ